MHNGYQQSWSHKVTQSSKQTDRLLSPFSWYHKSINRNKNERDEWADLTSFQKIIENNLIWVLFQVTVISSYSFRMFQILNKENYFFRSLSCHSAWHERFENAKCVTMVTAIELRCEGKPPNATQCMRHCLDSTTNLVDEVIAFPWRTPNVSIDTGTRSTPEMMLFILLSLVDFGSCSGLSAPYSHVARWECVWACGVPSQAPISLSWQLFHSVGSFAGIRIHRPSDHTLWLSGG